MCNKSSSNHICKTAAIGIKARAIEELLKTQALRNKLVENSSGSLISTGARWLASKGVPGAAGLQNIYQKVHSGLLKADTVVGSALRGEAKKGSLRYETLTNTRGSVPVKGKDDMFQLVDRASVAKPATFLAEATIVPAAVIGLESLRDPEGEIIHNQPGETV